MATREAKPLKKAEVVRERRKQLSNKHTERRVHRAHELPVTHSTPIFMRGGVVGTPVIQRTRTNVKRKITFPLQSGSELIIPGLPMFRPGWRALSGFISISLLMFLILTSFSSTFDIQAVSVTGLQRVNPTDIRNVLNLTGKPVFTIDPQAILVRIQETFPEFYDVEVSVAFPAAVNITVVERQPVIAWQYENLSIWIDEEGNIFPPRGTAEGLFTIQANAGPPRLQVPMTEAEIQAARKDLNTEEQNGVWLKDGPVNPVFVQELLSLQRKLPQTTSISFRTDDGFGWHDQENDWNVYFGHRLDELDQKLLLYEHIKNWVLEKGIHPDMISVAYLRAPFYRLEQ